MAPPADLHQDDAINGQAELDVEDLKGHSMLAPFTAGWQMKASQQLIIERSEGVYVYDNVGKKYLDALAGLWSTALGGHEKRLVDAAVRQLNVLPFYHSFWNRTTSPSLDLAKELLKFFEAEDMARVFFTNSGSEANDTQIKIVRFYNNALGRPQKKKIIARNKAYHGSTIASASLSGLPTLHKGFDLPEPYALHTDCPHYWRYHLPGESEEEYSTRLADNLEKLILKEGPDTVAAFIAEPVMGAGGVIPPPSTYFDKIQVILKRYDVLFIVDEVICAFGRLGTMFGCEMYNITPDLVSVAKALSSAYMPIGAVLVSHHVADAVLDHSSTLGSFGHGFTYSGHPVACAVALEALRMYKEIDITAHVQRVAPLFQDGIRGFVSSPIIGEIRGVGLIMGVEFTDEKSPDKLFPAEWDVAGFFAERSTEGGMLVRVVGNSICMSPPLIITEAEVQEMVCIFGKSLKSTEEYVKQRKKDAVL